MPEQTPPLEKTVFEYHSIIKQLDYAISNLDDGVESRTLFREANRAAVNYMETIEMYFPGRMRRQYLKMDQKLDRLIDMYLERKERIKRKKKIYLRLVEQKY